MNYKTIAFYTLIIAIITLFSMVPGGPVENRSFSNLLPYVALGFNMFIGSVLILAINAVFFMRKRQKWAYQAVAIVGLGYIGIFVLDLAKIFPVSVDPMSPLMFTLEVVALVLGFALVILSYLSVKTTQSDYWLPSSKSVKRAVMALVLFLLIIGVFVVTFATKSALA